MVCIHRPWAPAAGSTLYAGSLARKRVLEIVAENDVPSVLVLDACFSGTYGDAGASIAKGLQPLVLVAVVNLDQFAGSLPGVIGLPLVIYWCGVYREKEI